MQNTYRKDGWSNGVRGHLPDRVRSEPTVDRAAAARRFKQNHDCLKTDSEKRGKRAPLDGPTVWRPRGETAQNSVEPQVEANDWKQELGERVFREILRFLPDSHRHLCGKITGMIMENSEEDIYHDMKNDLATVRIINQALQVLNQSLRLDERPYMPTFVPKTAMILEDPNESESDDDPRFQDPSESESDDGDVRAPPESISTLLFNLPKPPTIVKPIPVRNFQETERVESPRSLHCFVPPQRATMPEEDNENFDEPPPVAQVIPRMQIALMPPEDIHIPVRRRVLADPSVASILSNDSNRQYQHEAEQEREEEIERAVSQMVNSIDTPYMSFLEKANQVVIDFFERHLPLMIDDFLNNKVKYFLTLISFLILILLALMAAFSNINWCYALAFDLMLAIVIVLQASGRYVFPDSVVDDLYLFRQYYTLVAFITLFALFIWSPFTLALLNFFSTWLILKRFSFAIFTALHLYIIARWGFLVTPFFIVHLCLVQELIFVRKATTRGIYKHPYLSLTNLTPCELEKRKVYDYMKKHPNVKLAKDYQDLEADPFFIHEATEEVMGDGRFRSYDVEEKKIKRTYPDGTPYIHTKYIYHDRDVRENKVVPFSDVRIKRPHFYQALLPLSVTRASNVLVCEELVNETIYLALQKFGESPPADGLTSITRSLAVKIHYYNLPNCPVLFTNSVAHGYNRYLMINKAREPTDRYLQTTAILLGLENASYGKFRHRWYLRNFWLPADHPFRVRLARFISAHMAITLIPIYGYLWRHVPRILQEKTPTAAAAQLMAMAGNDTVQSTNVTQTVQAFSNSTFLTNITDFIKNATRSIAGYSFLAYAQPLPAVNNYDNMIAGINGRLFVGEKKNVSIGHPKDYALNELRRTVQEDLERWEPLPDILTKEEWLDLSKNYSTAKKNMLLKLEDTGRYFDTFFLKWESYTGFKAPRIISNSDKKFLTVEGPVIKTIENQLESLPSTLTGIPVADWAKTVFNALEPYEDSDDYSIYVSDISSFESAITPPIKDATENLVFDRLLMNFPLLARKLRSRQQIRHYYKQMGEKVIEYDYSGRASGDARTYAGNTIVNHYLLRNLYYHFNLIPLPYFVSGDDAIFVLPKALPISEVEAYYADLGFAVEVKHTRIAESGFCGFNFEEQTFRRVCADPISTILKFFMTQFPFKLGKYRAYLADQCLCLLHEYPGDPVLRPAVEWMLRNMTHRNQNYRTWWQQQLMKDGNQWGALLRQPPMSFDNYSQLHPEHTPQFFEDLSEKFRDCVISICTHPDQYYAMKLQSMIAQVDLGTPREIFNEFRILDPYAIEYDIDVGYYYPNLELVQAAALGLIETY